MDNFKVFDVVEVIAPPVKSSLKRGYRAPGPDLRRQPYRIKEVIHSEGCSPLYKIYCNRHSGTWAFSCLNEFRMSGKDIRFTKHVFAFGDTVRFRGPGRFAPWYNGTILCYDHAARGYEISVHGGRIPAIYRGRECFRERPNVTLPASKLLLISMN